MVVDRNDTTPHNVENPIYNEENCVDNGESIYNDEEVTFDELQDNTISCTPNGSN